MTERSCVFERRTGQLLESDLAAGLQKFRELWDDRLAASLNACVHCGLCADSCHYFVATGDPKMQPAYKVGLVQSVFKRYDTSAGRLFPLLVGARDFDSATVREWIDSLFGSCSMCSRCTINCTVGLDISRIVRTGRSTLAAMGLVPPELQSTVDAAVQTGNNMAIPKAEWLDTAEWLNDELQQELGGDGPKFPIDHVNARMLYAVNPREVKFFPLSLLAAAKIFHVAGENWTFSGDYYDVTNYGLFSGDNVVAALISGRLHESMRKLKCNTLVLGECGHGYAANRWEYPEWAQRTPEYGVTSIVQLIAEYIRSGRIKLDRSKISARVTLHDPCNLVRMGGVIEEQRYILGHAVSDFVEMFPNREKNFCCGGGGGQLSMTRYARRRIEAGRVKADQIRKTGAKIVVTPCHNCIDQLSELNKEYKLGVEIKTLAEIVAEALVLEPSA
jgi:Fe-S oxidoreductase